MHNKIATNQWVENTLTLTFYQPLNFFMHLIFYLPTGSCKNQRTVGTSQLEKHHIIVV